MLLFLLVLWLLQVGSSPFSRRCDDKFDQDQAKRQQNKGEAGRESKFPRTESGSRECECHRQCSSWKQSQFCVRATWKKW